MGRIPDRRSGNIFYPSIAGPGTHTLTYTYSDGYCSAEAFRTINVGSIPAVSFTGLDTLYCDTDPIVLVTGYPASSLGSFVGDGITDNGDGTAYFNPATSGLGYHLISYKYTQLNGCSETFTQQVRVGTLLKFSGLGTRYCADDGDVTFTYIPSGGTFNAATGFSDNLNGTATLSPSAGTSGTRMINYTYTDIYGCVNNLVRSVQIAPVPPVNFVGINATGYCKNNAIVNLSGNRTPLGTFSGPGITDNGNGTAGFNPAILPAGGPYSVTYYFKDEATGCDNSVSKNTFVLTLPTAVISGNPVTCTGDNALVTIDFSGTGPYSFTWTDGLSSNTVNNAGDPYNLTVSLSQTSVITIPFVTRANGCSNAGSGQANVTVNPMPLIVSDPVDKTICDGNNVTFQVSATGPGLTYQWKKDGAVLPGKNNNVLIINDVQTTDEGSYTCVVTSLCGTPLTSGPGILTVLPATTITTQPSDATVCEEIMSHSRQAPAGRV